MKGASADKAVGYFVVSIVVAIVVYAVIGIVLGIIVAMLVVWLRGLTGAAAGSV